MMQLPAISLPEHLSLEWITSELGALWQPFLLGSFVSGVVCAILGYSLTMLYWRWWVRRSWQKRQLLRRQQRHP
ncbi:hypothetical protein D3C75_999460 [compost metagenome]